ncbi:hypothetical protein J3F84DRAFT_387142 [Trichoderma pleuroticola]
MASNETDIPPEDNQVDGNKTDLPPEDHQVDETTATETHTENTLPEITSTENDSNTENDATTETDDTPEKVQPWKAGWMARNAEGEEKPEAKGLSHGTEKGEDIINGGFTSGVAIRMTLGTPQ